MINTFIKDNNLSFALGSRNSTITVIIGYSQFKKITLLKLKEYLKEQIENDPFISTELDRLWEYCKRKNYSKFWNTENAKKQYKF